MKKRILVVEDDAALARVLRNNLLFEGFDVEWVADGNLVPSTARAFAPDLILLDIMLPGRDGFDLFGLLRQGGPTPIIVLTARGQKADKLRGLNLGADDYVTKPLTSRSFWHESTPYSGASVPTSIGSSWATSPWILVRGR